MKKSELKIGNRYTVQTDDDQVDVRLIEINEAGKFYRCARLDNKRTIIVRRLKDFLEELPAPVPVAALAHPTFNVTGTELVSQLIPMVPKDVFEGRGPGSGLVPNKDQFPSPQKASGFAAAIREQQTRVPGCTGPHVIIKARAGTGKTTTMIEGLRELKGWHKCRACNGAKAPAMPVCALCRGTGNGVRLTPSEQQQAVWDSICLSKDARSVCMVAFNKDIAEELQRRVPPGVNTQTIHSMGYQTVKKAFPAATFNEERLQKIIGKVLDKSFKRALWDEPCAVQAVMRLASLCKLNLIPMSLDDAEDEDEVMHRNAILVELADYHGVELEDSDGKDWTCRVCELVPQVIDLCLHVDHDLTFDHDDMIWLPIVRELSVYRYDLLFVDEAQDLNRCQQALVKMAGHRLIFCGDDRQAIYGFAGSDAESIATLDKDMGRQPRGCVTLPLTVTRRCGWEIVEEAKRLVPDFEAHPANSRGRVRTARYGDNGRPGPGTYHDEVQQGDMIICRVTAPLVSQCLTFLNRGRYATIQGRDMVSGLRSLAERCGGILGALEDYPGGFLDKLATWRDKETAQEAKKPDPSMNKLMGIQDRYNCLVGFYNNFIGTAYEGQNTATHVAMSSFLASIDNVFSEKAGAQAIRLSTIHKAKGLEARRVFFLMPERAECPHPLAKKEWQRGQEYNLLYVGITRAIEELIYVR